MLQKRYSEIFASTIKLIQQNLIELYKILKTKEIQGVFSTLTINVLFFRDIKALKKQ